jgi:hypothetical protein
MNRKTFHESFTHFSTNNTDNYEALEFINGVPQQETSVLVGDTYPAIGKNQISNDTSSKMWWHYPVFTLGSYSQVTNNIRYPNNPDEGTCMPGSMCGAIYHDKNLGSNRVKQLPPVTTRCNEARVNYYLTQPNMFSFRTSFANILY